MHTIFLPSMLLRKLTIFVLQLCFLLLSSGIIFLSFLFFCLKYKIFPRFISVYVYAMQCTLCINIELSSILFLNSSISMLQAYCILEIFRFPSISRLHFMSPNSNDRLWYSLSMLFVLSALYTSNDELFMVISSSIFCN